MSADRKGVKSNVRIDGDTSVRSSRYICPHASKALRVRSSTTKDRHCKVNTPKGHRDRRVRLAVSTAIQLYSLQHRLGLQQPSKVLDWLISKSKSAIDELPIPSFISNLNCRACNTIVNNGPTVGDVLSSSRGADAISQSLPKILPLWIEKENETGSRAVFTEEAIGEDLNVAANNGLRLSMLQNRTEASTLVPMCSERKRLPPSVLLKNGNTQEEIALTSTFQEQEGVAMTSPFQQQSGWFDVGFSLPYNSNAILAPFNSLHMPRHEEIACSDMHSRTPPLPTSEAQFRRHQQIIRAESSTANRFDSSQHDGKTNNFSQKCTTRFTSFLQDYDNQDNDNIYGEERLRLSGNINSYMNTNPPNPPCESLLVDDSYNRCNRSPEDALEGKGLQRLKHYGTYTERGH